MKKVYVLLVVLVLTVSVNAGTVTFTAGAASAPTQAQVGNGVYFDVNHMAGTWGSTSNKKTETKSTLTSCIGQNFVPTKSFTLDKIALQTGFHATAATLVVPAAAGGAELKLQIWQYTGAGGVPSVSPDSQQYAGALSVNSSATTDGNWTQVAAFTQWMSSALATSIGVQTLAADTGWLTFDVDDTLTLTAGIQYAYATVWTYKQTEDLGTKALYLRRQMGNDYGSTQAGMAYGENGIYPANYLVTEGSTGSYALIPEPTTIALLSLGLVCLRKRK